MKTQPKCDDHVLHVHHLPKWARADKHIYTGYLKPGLDVIKIFFSWHNETLNIWTQVIPFILFWGISIYAYNSPENDMYHIEPFVFRWTAFGFSIQLITSTFAHAFARQSELFHTICWKFDYVGIAMVSYSTSYLLETLLDYSDEAILVTTLFYFAATILTLLYSSTLQLLVLPTLMALSFHLLLCQEIIQHYPTPFYIICISATLGIFFYTTKFPECISPATFDIIGASHQYWHICTSAGMAGNFYICWHLSIDKHLKRNFFAPFT